MRSLSQCVKIYQNNSQNLLQQLVFDACLDDSRFRLRIIPPFSMLHEFKYLQAIIARVFTKGKYNLHIMTPNK
jgi:hypothetical protein